jgi:hypothetical protein
MQLLSQLPIEEGPQLMATNATDCGDQAHKNGSILSYEHEAWRLLSWKEKGTRNTSSETGANERRLGVVHSDGLHDL